MKLAVLIASRNRPDLVASMVERIGRATSLPHDVFVVECGTEPDQLSPHSTLWYADPDFRGKCWGHNLALRAAELQGEYDYFWVLMNDVVFPDGVDAARVLVETMERAPRMAILSPTNADGQYPGSARRPGGGWRKVTTCDYLGFLMRGAALRDAGFLSPDFRYCWGAIHDLSYRLYREGWFVAYSDDVTYEHLGGSTYGVPGTATIPREEYQRRARLQALDLLRERHGDNWHEVFWAACGEHRLDIEIDTFARHRAAWEAALSDAERAERAPAPDGRGDEPAERRMRPLERPGAVRLHLGCGPEYREGWINVDTNPDSKADVVTTVQSLSMFTDGSVDVIEACHLFEHLTYGDALRSLEEWSRVLREGGELFLEMPDLDACIRMLGRYTDKRGFDLGLIGLYGWPPVIEEEGVPQIHKWGWSRPALTEALRAAGFGAVEFGPVTQTWRPGARTGRDFRVRAVRVAATAAAIRPELAAPRATKAPASLRREEPPAPLPSQPSFGGAGKIGGRVSDPEPWPLATAAGVRLFAWPRYDDPAELERLFAVHGRPLVGRVDACLCLRRDPETDGARDAVLDALSTAHARALGEDAELEVLLVEEPLDGDAWRRLGRAVAGVLDVAAHARGERARRIAQMGAEPVEDVASLLAPAAGAAPKFDRALAAEMEALHPWFYPVEIGNLRVRPGVGTHLDPEFLEERTRCRATLLVDEVARRIDLRGRRLLDLACNCAFWTSHWARRGATSVVGVEGRDLHVRQAELYWSRNGFVPPDAARFLHGNVADPATWDALRELGPYDVTLCAGILYHVPNYREVLAWAAAATREVLVVDTRVSDADEEIVEEPGDLHFNAIAETRAKVVPNREQLLATLSELGLAAEVLPVGFPTGLGVADVDDYARGRRVTIVARHVPALGSLPARADTARPSAAAPG